MELEKIPRKRATDEVYDSLRQAILTGVFPPGDRLQIEDISMKLGVSLTPVRHAIQQLSAEGLIVIHPRSGTYVAELSPEDVRETSQIRCALECLAVELACARITVDELDQIHGVLRELAREVSTGEDRKRHESDNREFHMLIVKASGNQRLVEMYSSLNAHLQIARIHSANQDWQARLAQEQMEHDAIFTALEQQDSVRAVETMKAHINRAQDALSRALKGAA